MFTFSQRLFSSALKPFHLMGLCLSSRSDKNSGAGGSDARKKKTSEICSLLWPFTLSNCSSNISPTCSDAECFDLGQAFSLMAFLRELIRC